MRKHFLLSFLLISIISSAQMIETKDGVTVGSMSSFINSCVEGIAADSIEFNGMKINAESYCECMAKEFIPQVSSEQLKEASKNGEEGIAMLMMEEPYFSILMDCARPNIEVEDNYKVAESGKMKSFRKQAGIKACINETKELGLVDSVLTLEETAKYCECAIERVFENNISYGDIKEFEDIESEGFNEIALPCLYEAMENSILHEDSSTSVQIKKGDSICIVDLIPQLDKGYKIEIKIGRKKIYPYFDTGASYLIIPRSIYKELKKKDQITEDGIIKHETLSLADNREVKAPIVIIKEIKIGCITLHNVTAAIIDEGSSLFGQSVLTKFSAYQINNLTQTVTFFE